MLTTRCPHCHTVFRVRPEQLSVRSGRVRCGHCQQPFSALSHLEEMEGEAPVPAPHSAVVAAPQPVTPTATPPVVVPESKPVPIQKPVVIPSFSAQTVAPGESSAWSALDATPVAPPAVAVSEHIPSFQATSSSPAVENVPEPVAPTFASLLDNTHTGASSPVMRATEVESPAIGDDFSMTIGSGSANLAVPVPANEDMDFDLSGLDEAVANPSPEPVNATLLEPSELAKSLGVRAFDPARDQVFDQTVMLEEPIELMGLPSSDNNPDSLFVERERQRIGSLREHVEDRRRSSGAWLWVLGIVVLSLLAVMQLSYVFRVDLARVIPPLRPHLEAACAKLGCKVAYPQDADLITLEGHSFDPDSTGEGKYHLNFTLLNRAAYQQAWPHLELTVTDRFDIAVARRVFAPAEWLPASDAAQLAFDGHSEITANLPLALRNVQAAGYRLYVFYP